MTLSFNLATGTLPPGATLTRPAGSWSRVKADKTIERGTAADVPRYFYHPVTGEFLGLAIEGEVFNRIASSENIALPDWNIPTGGVNSTVNTYLSPAGDFTADFASPTTVNTTHNVNVANSAHAGLFPVGLYLTKSWYAKAAGYRYFRLNFPLAYMPGGRGAVYDLIAGTFITEPAATGQMEYVGNGYYRCSLTALVTADSGVPVNPGAIGINSTTDPAVPGMFAGNQFVGDGVSGIALWGGQMEIGRRPTTYIWTPEGIGATRYAERLELDWQLADGPYSTLYTFDDYSTQSVATEIVAGKSVVPTNLNRPILREAKIISLSASNVGYVVDTGSPRAIVTDGGSRFAAIADGGSRSSLI